MKNDLVVSRGQDKKQSRGLLRRSLQEIVNWIRVVAMGRETKRFQGMFSRYSRGQGTGR